jgi:hypothetical protein
MKIYIWSKKEKQMLNYDAKQIDDFGTIIRITFYNGNEIIIPKDDYQITQIKEK